MEVRAMKSCECSEEEFCGKCGLTKELKRRRAILVETAPELLDALKIAVYDLVNNNGHVCLATRELMCKAIDKAEGR
jgi:hypothetical protein